MTEPRDFWRDRPVLVTGATGLVGGWTVRRLVELGADVVCLVRDHVPQSTLLATELASCVKLVHGDVADPLLLERALGEYEISSVIHLAAQTIVGVANRNPLSTFQSNIAGTWTVLEAARRSPTVESVVIASSDKAYGDQAEPYTEDTPLRGRYPYDVSKSCADLIAHSYAETYELPVAITRCGNFFGGGDLNWSRLVPGTIRSLLRGERPVIRSDGGPVRDYFYVENGVDAYLLLGRTLVERPEVAGQAFNFANEDKLTVREMVERITRLMGSDLEPDVQATAHHEIQAQALCSDKARERLGWRPRFELEEGLARTVEWYRKFLGSGW